MARIDDALQQLGIDVAALAPGVLQSLRTAAETPTPSSHRTTPPTRLSSDVDELQADRRALVAEWGEPDPADWTVSRDHRQAGQLIRSLDRKIEQAEARAERNAELDAETDPRRLAEGLH